MMMIMLMTINQRTLTFFFIILQTVNSFSSTSYNRGTYSGLETYIVPLTTSTNGRYNTKYPYTTSSEVMSPNRNRNNERETTASNVRDLALRIIDLPHIIIILLSSITQSITQSVTSSIRKYWWCFPMSLALYPPYCSIFKGTCATMPEWWSMINMEYITASENANWIIGPFLASNISYILCGIYLMNRFRFFQTSSLNGDIEFRPTK